MWVGGGGGKASFAKWQTLQAQSPLGYCSVLASSFCPSWPPGISPGTSTHMYTSLALAIFPSWGRLSTRMSGQSRFSVRRDPGTMPQQRGRTRAEHFSKFCFSRIPSLIACVPPTVPPANIHCAPGTFQALRFAPVI